MYLFFNYRHINIYKYNIILFIYKFILNIIIFIIYNYDFRSKANLPPLKCPTPTFILTIYDLF